MDMIRPVLCECLEEGVIFKKSFRRYVWEFYLEKALQHIEVEHSLISKQRRIIVNHRCLYDHSEYDDLF